MQFLDIGRRDAKKIRSFRQRKLAKSLACIRRIVLMPQKVQLVRDKPALSKNDLMKAKLFILVSRDHDIHLRYVRE